MAWPFELARIYQESTGPLDVLWWVLQTTYGRRIIGAITVLGGLIFGVFEWVGFGRVLRLVLDLVFGIPAPGQPLAPTTWQSPTNGLWPELMAVSQVAVGIAVLLLVIPVLQVAQAKDDRARWQAIRRLLYAGVMIATTWTVLPVVLHLLDQLAYGLSPSVDLWTETRRIPVQGVLAVVVGVFTLIVQPVVLITSLLSMLVLHALIMIGFVLWPIAWTLRIVMGATGGAMQGTSLTAASVGRTVTTLFTIAVVTKVLEAVLAFVVLHINWAAGLAECAAFAIGLGVFVYLPIAMLQNAERVLRLAWLAPRSEQVGMYIEESVDRVGQAHDFAREWHEERTTPTQSTIDDWTEDRSVSRWRRWIPRQFPEESYTSWGWDRMEGSGGTGSDGQPADGSFGPESQGPTEEEPASKPPRWRSKWHREK